MFPGPQEASYAVVVIVAGQGAACSQKATDEERSRGIRASRESEEGAEASGYALDRKNVTLSNPGAVTLEPNGGGGTRKSEVRWPSFDGVVSALHVPTCDTDGSLSTAEPPCVMVLSKLASRRGPGGLLLAAAAGRPLAPWVSPQSASGSRGPPAAPGPGQLRPEAVPGGTGTGSPPVRPDAERGPPTDGAVMQLVVLAALTAVSSVTSLHTETPEEQLAGPSGQTSGPTSTSAGWLKCRPGLERNIPSPARPPSPSTAEATVTLCARKTAPPTCSGARRTTPCQ